MTFSFGFPASPWFRFFLILVLWEVALFDHLAISFSPVAQDLHRRHGTKNGISPRLSHDSAVARSTREERSATVRSVKQISMPTPKKTWQVWKAISQLEEILLEYNSNGIHNDNDGSSLDHPNFPLYPASSELVTKVLSILKTLATQHEGKPEWQGLLNKSTLLHEVEESIVAIHFLQQELWSKQASSTFSTPREIVLVDVCCGKGVFSLLSSYVFSSSSLSQTQTRIRKIIMLDKDPKLRWDHIHASNIMEDPTPQQQRPFIECWPRFNLHEIDDVVDRLSKEVETKNSAETSLAMVGIHLCKTLSPACIGIANLLGPQKCPHFILAPCCLPRVVVQSRYSKAVDGKSSTPRVLEVRQYETPTERNERHLAKQRRNAAMVRGRGERPTTMGQQVVLDTKNPPAIGACWKCGEFGHVKADCPSNQSTGKPQLVKPPSLSLPVTGILDTDRPFGSYCDLLSTSIQRSRVAVEETGLTNSHMISKKQQKQTKQQSIKDPNNSNPQQANNWNRERKSIYIVASEEKVAFPNST